MKTVLIVGGAGYIGSYVAKLAAERYRVLIMDNLSSGHADAIKKQTLIKGDICDGNQLDAIFQAHSIDAVMHFAALKDVGESVRHPAIYYQNNVAGTLNLLDAMRRHAVAHLIFSSTAAVYGMPQHLPIMEEAPCHPINPYGKSKLFVEEMLKDYERSYGIKSVSLRYFNAAGADPSGAIKITHFSQPNLIPIILNCLQKKVPVTIYGSDYATADGTCIRDYIHIHDLATAHLLALEQLFAGASSALYNLGNGKGFSVKEVIKAVETVTGKKIPIVEGPRRSGDPAVLYADASKAKMLLKWSPKYPDIETIILHGYRAL